jgi:hypothetical protein
LPCAPEHAGQAYADVGEHAIQTGGILNAAIAATSSPGFWTIPFQTTVTNPRAAV